MSLEFSYSNVILARGHTRDDIHLHQTTMSTAQVDYMTDMLKANESCMISTWRLATLSKEFVVHGHRKENALWRIWAQQRLRLKRVSPLSINWNKDNDQNYNVILGPLIDSGSICHTRLALLNVRAAPPKPRRSNSWLDGKRMGQIRPSNLIHRKLFYPIDPPATSENLAAVPTSRKPRVKFDTCILQAEIIEASDDDVAEYGRDQGAPGIRILPPAGLNSGDSVEMQSEEPIEVSTLRSGRRSGLKREKAKFSIEQDECDDTNELVAGAETYLEYDMASSQIEDRGTLKREKVKFILGGDESDESDGDIEEYECAVVPSLLKDSGVDTLKREEIEFILGGDESDYPDGDIGECGEVAASISQGDVVPNPGFIAWFGAAVLRTLIERWWR